MSRRPLRRRVVAAVGLSVVLAGGAWMTGCAPAPAPTPSPTTVAPTTAPPPSPAPTTAAPPPSLHPDGSADDNLPLFRAVTAKVWASHDRAKGRAYIDALVKAGFDKAAMQVTNDRSTVGNPAESIQFSVHWDDECLVGQVGPATGKPVTVVLPALPGGNCLIGDTRPIDW